MPLGGRPSLLLLAAAALLLCCLALHPAGALASSERPSPHASVESLLGNASSWDFLGQPDWHDKLRREVVPAVAAALPASMTTTRTLLLENLSLIYVTHLGNQLEFKFLLKEVQASGRAAPCCQQRLKARAGSSNPCTALLDSCLQLHPTTAMPPALAVLYRVGSSTTPLQCHLTTYSLVWSFVASQYPHLVPGHSPTGGDSVASGQHWQPLSADDVASLAEFMENYKDRFLPMIVIYVNKQEYLHAQAASSWFALQWGWQWDCPVSSLLDRRIDHPAPLLGPCWDHVAALRTFVTDVGEPLQTPVGSSWTALSV